MPATKRYNGLIMGELLAGKTLSGESTKNKNDVDDFRRFNVPYIIAVVLGQACNGASIEITISQQRKESKVNLLGNKRFLAIVCWALIHYERLKLL